MKSPAEQFVDEMLGQLWRQFYPNKSREFHQDRRVLVQAVTWPARYLNERGTRAPASTYRRILSLVLATIRQKGNLKIVRRFSVYFIHSVQEHMKYHGEEYYQAAKAAHDIRDIVPKLAKSLQVRCPIKPLDQTTDRLAELNKLMRSPGGRRRKSPIRQPELPSFHASKSGKQMEVAAQIVQP